MSHALGVGLRPKIQCGIISTRVDRKEGVIVSRLGVKTAIARAVVDKDWRARFLGDMRGAIDTAGYDVTDGELSMLECGIHGEASFDDRIVNIDSLMELFKISEDRINRIMASRAAGRALTPAEEQEA